MTGACNTNKASILLLRSLLLSVVCSRMNRVVKDQAGCLNLAKLETKSSTPRSQVIFDMKKGQLTSYVNLCGQKGMDIGEQDSGYKISVKTDAKKQQ